MTTTVAFEAAELHTALSNAWLFTDKTGIRPILAAVRFQLGPAGCSVEATDSYGLYTEILDMSAPAGPDVSVLVDRDDVDRLVKTLRPHLKVGAPVGVVVEAHDVVFAVAGTSVKFTLIEGEFPSTKALWPTDIEPSLDGGYIGFGAWQLARLGKVKTEAKGVDVKLKLTPYGVGKPTVVDWGNTRRALLMPVRYS